MRKQFAGLVGKTFRAIEKRIDDTSSPKPKGITTLS